MGKMALLKLWQRNKNGRAFDPGRFHCISSSMAAA